MENTSAYPGGLSQSSTPNAVQRGVDSVGTALHDGIDKVADPARRSVDRLSTAAHETVEKLASSTAEVTDRFSEQTRRVTEAPGRVLEETKSWVREKPLEAVGTALAFGFIVGWLSAR